MSTSVVEFLRSGCRHSQGLKKWNEYRHSQLNFSEADVDIRKV